MNIFAGNLVFDAGTQVVLEDFDFLETLSSTGDKVVYVFGETQIKSSEELREHFTKLCGTAKYIDLSISTEDALGVVPYDYEHGVYECACFEGESISFDEIADRFEDVEGVFAIREAETSQLFGNRVVKVDFIY